MKIDNDTIQQINLFEGLTKSRVKDCFEYNDRLTFIVNEGQIMDAVGKGGKKIQRIEEMFNRKLKVIEFSDDPEKFLRSFISPVKPKSIEINERIIEVVVTTSKDRGILIGRSAKNLNMLKEVLGKYFGLDIKIVN